LITADWLLSVTGHVDFSDDVLNLFDGHIQVFVGDVLVRHEPHSRVVYLRYPHGRRSYLIVRLTVASISVHLCKGCQVFDKLFFA